MPREGSRAPVGQNTVAGAAWAPDRGIKAVEISLDGGPWQPCTISMPISKATWVQWQAQVNLTAGEHRIEVRATDGTGTVQTADVSRDDFLLAVYRGAPVRQEPFSDEDDVTEDHDDDR